MQASAVLDAALIINIGNNFRKGILNMTAFITTVGSYITAFIEGIGDWASFAANNNLVMLLLGISLVGGLLGLLIHFIKGV